MNTQKGFSSILALLLTVSVIGGGYYFYSTNKRPSEDQEVVSGAIKDTDVATTTKGEPKKVDQFEAMSKEDADFTGFYFTKTNKAIIDPVTRTIVEKKQNITQSDLGDTGKIVKQDANAVLVEIFTGGCLGTDGGDGWASIYVYASNSSEKVYAFTFSNDATEDLSYEMSHLSAYIEKTGKEPERTGVVIQPVPGESISDGYHYAKSNQFSISDGTITLDFLSLRKDVSHGENIDILFSNTSNTRGPSANILLENEVENPRIVPLSQSMVDRVRESAIGPDPQELIGREVLIRIQNGTVTELFPVTAAC